MAGAGCTCFYWHRRQTCRRGPGAGRGEAPASASSHWQPERRCPVGDAAVGCQRRSLSWVGRGRQRRPGRPGRHCQWRSGWRGGDSGHWHTSRCALAGPAVGLRRPLPGASRSQASYVRIVGPRREQRGSSGAGVGRPSRVNGGNGLVHAAGGSRLSCLALQRDERTWATSSRGSPKWLNFPRPGQREICDVDVVFGHA